MMKTIITAVTITFLMSTLSSSAQQGELRLSVGLAGAVPGAQFKELVDKTTFRGADITILYGISDRLSVGLNTGFQDFYQKFPRAVYKLEDGSDISAVISNSIQTIPLLATGRYNFMPEAKIQPYASAGVGGVLVLNKQYIGEYPIEDNKISFAARPGVGLYIPFKKDGETGLNLGANYTYISYKQNDMSNLNYIGFTVGIGFPMRN